MSLTEATAQDFFVADGRRWFRTGDIAVADPDGCFRIIGKGNKSALALIRSILYICIVCI